MTRIDQLRTIFATTGLSEILSIRKEDEFADREYSSLRFKTNKFRVRAIEIWEKAESEGFFRIYHSEKMASEIKELLDSIAGHFSSGRNVTDYHGDYLSIAKEIYQILSSETVNEVAERSHVLSSNSYYEGLSLPDIDTTDDTDILGRTFDWRELLAIDEDRTESNKLREALSQNGVYLQRSVNGTSRYVGSAYGGGGLFARWLKHLKSNGDAKHLNLFVLEHGYSDLLFTVLEFTSNDDATQAEAKWKNILGTRNGGPYDGVRLNSN